MSLQLTGQQQLRLESQSKLVGRIVLLETTLRRFLTGELVLEVHGPEDVRRIVRNIKAERDTGWIESDDPDFLRGVDAEVADLLSQLESEEE